MSGDKSSLQPSAPTTGVKLSLLWASLMFLYIYNDYFSMYLPGTIEDMSAGRIGPLGEATDAMFVLVSLMLAIPALMIYLSAALPASASRWLNIFLGLAYTVIEVLTFGKTLFYQIVVALEIVVTTLIVWTAFKWPKR